jgi:hypothetical protein
MPWVPRIVGFAVESAFAQRLQPLLTLPTVMAWAVAVRSMAHGSIRRMGESPRPSVAPTNRLIPLYGAMHNSEVGNRRSG